MNQLAAFWAGGCVAAAALWCSSSINAQDSGLPSYRLSNPSNPAPDAEAPAKRSEATTHADLVPGLSLGGRILYMNDPDADADKGTYFGAAVLRLHLFEFLSLEALGANAVERTYAVSARDAMDSAVAVVSDLDLKVEKREGDALGGHLTAKRSDGSDVIVFIKSLEMNRSRVTVKVGQGDLALANLVQTQIAERMKKGASRAPSTTPPAAQEQPKTPETPAKIEGTKVENRYNVDMNTAVNAARSALRTIGIPISNERKEENLTLIDAQKGDSPIQIAVRKIEDKVSNVTFTVGGTKKEDSQKLLDQIKKEFESALNVPPSDRP